VAASIGEQAASAMLAAGTNHGRLGPFPRDRDGAGGWRPLSPEHLGSIDIGAATIG